LCKRAFNQGFNVTNIYADTVGDPTKYANFLTVNLSKHAEILKKVVVESKADATYKVVSASSICAKVTRDSILKNWKFAEKICNLIKSNLEFKGELGSGYPGDPKTKQWLVNNRHKMFGYPNIVRFSWSTASNNLSSTLKMKVI
jgi:ribonuclease H2 subunit A